MLKKVYLEITDICNLNCRFCPGTRRTPELMPVERFDTLTDSLKGYTEYLYFHLMGEPMLHPQLEELLSIAGVKGFKVIITTNGTLLANRGDLLLNSPHVHKINISLQSFEGNMGSAPKNYLSDCAHFAHRAGETGKICVLRLWNTNGYDSLNPVIEKAISESFPLPWQKSRNSLLLADRVFLEHGNMFDWPDSSIEPIGESCYCYGLKDQIGVLCDGTVVPCCLDHDGEIALGNLLDTPLDKILNSPRAVNMRTGFSQRRASEELCRRCGYARRF